MSYIYSSLCNIDLVHLLMMALTPAECFSKSSLVEYICNHCFLTKDAKLNTVLPGVSIIAAGLQKLGAPETLLRYMKKHAWKINSILCCFMFYKHFLNHQKVLH